MTLEQEEGGGGGEAPSCLLLLRTLDKVDKEKEKQQQAASVGEAVEALLAAAQRQGCLTVGVYEAAKLLNADPDSVVLCLLAIDKEDEEDIALQIHFTLIQAFCCDNDINILRVSGMERLAAVLGEGGTQGGTPATAATGETEPRDLHCILVTNPHSEGWKSQGLAEVASFCEDCRGNNQWVPYVSLQAR